MVSIVLCTYNRAHTLRATLESIFSQTYRDFELIIVDDGSTDDTQNLLREYEDPRMQVCQMEENSFYCAAANFGMEKAKGEYIAFATSDDLWERTKLEKQVDYLEKRTECGACFSFGNVIDDDGEDARERHPGVWKLFHNNYFSRKEWMQRFIYEGNCLLHPSAVVRREVLQEVGGYSLFFSLLADMDLWLRIVRRYSIHVVEEELVSYRCFRESNAQVSGTNETHITKSLNEHTIIRRNFINSLTDAEMLEFFNNCFRYKQAYTHLELEIEKAFLLMHSVKDLPDFWALGMEKLEELLRDPEVLPVLQKTYHVRLQDIYQWNTKHFYMDYSIHNWIGERDQTIIRQADTIQKLQEQIQKEQRRNAEASQRLAESAARLGELETAQEQERQEWTKALHKEQEALDRMRIELSVTQEELLEEKRRYVVKEQEWEAVTLESREKTRLLNQALLEKLELKEKKGRH